MMTQFVLALTIPFGRLVPQPVETASPRLHTLSSCDDRAAVPKATAAPLMVMRTTQSLRMIPLSAVQCQSGVGPRAEYVPYRRMPGHMSAAPWHTPLTAVSLRTTRFRPTRRDSRGWITDIKYAAERTSDFSYGSQELSWTHCLLRSCCGRTWHRAHRTCLPRQGLLRSRIQS